MTPEYIKATLGLVPLPAEGGWWTQTHRDEHSTAIYYFLEAGERSLLHRLSHPEIYHWYAGSPLQLLVLRSDASHEAPVLGPDLAAGQRPQLTVPAHAWQGSTPSGPWTLVGTTMAPGYLDSEFELGDSGVLLAAYPHLEDRIRELTK